MGINRRLDANELAMPLKIVDAFPETGVGHEAMREG